MPENLPPNNIIQRQLPEALRVGPGVKAFVGYAFLGLILFFVLYRPPHNHRKAYEATVRSNLQRYRSIISQFHTDTGVYPHSLSDLVAPAGSTPVGVAKGKYKGPYMTPNGGIGDKGLPSNPFVKSSAGINSHWRYDPKTGKVRSAVEGTTIDGQAYTAL